jgi:hypothetical protein
MKRAGLVVLGLALAILFFLYIRGSICGIPHTALPSAGPGLTEFASSEWCKKFPWQYENGEGTSIPLPITSK